MKKLSNKILLIGLVILIGIFAASRFFRSPARESNLRKDLLKLDTAAIDEVDIVPSREHAAQLKLKREGNIWKVSKGERIEPANQVTVKSMLGTLASMQAQRMATRKKEKWEEYNVGENSTHVSVVAGGNKVADFHVGKLGFVQNSGGGFGGAYTYVRLSDENEVYVVEGFLESSFNNGFNDWRDKTFLKLNTDNITKISFRYPGDSSFVIEKPDSVWRLANEMIDPAKVDGLLNQFRSKILSDFADDFSPTAQADVVIQVDGKTGNIATVEAWKKDASEWICTSSRQKGVYFSSKGSTLATELFISKNKLLVDVKK